MRLRSVFPLIAALAAAASLTLTGCDASPYAATVDGHTISQAALNNQLKQWAGNKAWVATLQNANSGLSVQGDGGPDTYSSTFVADILANMIEITILHQHLAATGQLPTPSELTASRAVNEFLRADYWNQFPQSLRTMLVEQLADQAPLTPVTSDTASLQGAFQQIKPYLFSNLCLTETAAPTLADAQNITTEGIVGGAQVCYDQAAMEDQPPVFRDAVLKLDPGQVSAPIRTGFGYEVVELQTKDTPGFDDGVQRVLTVALASNPTQATVRVIQQASVKVNPAYGTWSDGQIKTPQLSSS